MLLLLLELPFGIACSQARDYCESTRISRMVSHAVGHEVDASLKSLGV